MLQYKYSNEIFKIKLGFLVFLWTALLAFRITLFSYLGETYIHSPLNVTAGWFSGVLIGMSIQLLMIRRKSIPSELADLTNT